MRVFCVLSGLGHWTRKVTQSLCMRFYEIWERIGEKTDYGSMREIELNTVVWDKREKRLNERRESINRLESVWTSFEQVGSKFVRNHYFQIVSEQFLCLWVIVLSPYFSICVYLWTISDFSDGIDSLSTVLRKRLCNLIRFTVELHTQKSVNRIPGDWLKGVWKRFTPPIAQYRWLTYRYRAPTSP